jgi:hypothetical protein
MRVNATQSIWSANNRRSPFHRSRLSSTSAACRFPAARRRMLADFPVLIAPQRLDRQTTPMYESPTIHSETSPSTASTQTKCCRGETLTLQRLKLPPSPYKCLATTDVIESPQSGGAPHGERHAVARSGGGGALGRLGLAAQGEELPQNRWPSRSVGVGHDLGPQSLVQPIAGEASVK